VNETGLREMPPDDLNDECTRAPQDERDACIASPLSLLLLLPLFV